MGRLDACLCEGSPETITPESDLGEDDLQRAKEDQPGVVGDVAGVVNVSMEAV